MAGIYIHVPFCPSRCIYCAFYSQTNLTQRYRYVNALIRDIEQNEEHNESDETIETLYFGGGTPSQLSADDLDRIFNALHKRFDLSQLKECTIEANPEDVSRPLAEHWYHLGINRASLGIQSFSDQMLKFLHRRHSSQTACDAVRTLQEVGIINLSVDLIFAFPGMNLSEWSDNIDQAIALHTPHLSAYGLTYEEGTALERMRQKGQVQQLDDPQFLEQFDLLIDRLQAHGYEQYEISNFARPNQRALHNSAYWQRKPYYAFGPSANGFDGTQRYGNVDELDLYCERLEQGQSPRAFTEQLTANDIYNEFVMLGLRTKEGVDLNRMAETLDSMACERLCSDVKRLIDPSHIIIDSGQIHLTRAGIAVSDQIIADLFI